MDRRVVVTGMGVVSPIGNDLQEAWHNVITGRCAIKKLDDRFNHVPCRIGALVDKSTLHGYDYLNRFTGLSHSTKLAVIACAEAITDAGFNMDDTELLNTSGVICGNSVIEMSELIDSYRKFEEDGMDGLDKYTIFRLLLGMPASILVYKLKTKGPVISLSASAATGLVTIGKGFRFLKQNTAVNVMICGGTDSAVNPYIYAIYSQHDILTTKYNDNPTKASRPFDKQRSGEVLGEGSGFIILEELNHALQRNARIYCEVKGFSIATDFIKYKENRTSEGIIVAMRNALAEAHCLPDSVSYVNANGSSNVLMDYYEATALQNLFGDRKWELFVSSTKGAHGNMMSASGVIETAFTCMAIYDGILPPTLNVDPEDNEFVALNFLPNHSVEFYSRRKIVLKNSISNLGINASICLAPFEH